MSSENIKTTSTKTPSEDVEIITNRMKNESSEKQTKNADNEIYSTPTIPINS